MKRLLTALICSCSMLVHAQEMLLVNRIDIEGLKVSKEESVLRELSFAVGDSIPATELDDILEENINHLQNQWLFNFIEFKEKKEGHLLNLTLEVVERWYVWPYPILEISERNFNVFWDSLQSSHFQDFSRLNYGVFLNWYNFRGRNELLKIKYRKGYREHYMLEYDIPYLNKKKSWGSILKVEQFRMSKFHYQTQNNQLLYTSEDLFKDNKVSFTLQHKPAQQEVHKIGVEWNQLSIGSQTLALNPHFFPHSSTNFNFLKTEYFFTQERRNYKHYPTKGSYQEVQLGYYHGLATDYQNLSLRLKREQHWSIDQRWSTGTSLLLQANTKKDIPYALYESLGFDDYVRGYEYYVVDGSRFFVHKAALRYLALPKTNIKLPLIPWEQFNKTHLSVYFSIFADMGYAASQSAEAVLNPLNNSLLSSQGVSMDIITYYDKLIRLEYSRNHLGETGFFIHFSNPF